MPRYARTRRSGAEDRDDALLRLTRVNRWLLAGSLALTGLLTDVVAHAFPGKAPAGAGVSRSANGARAHGAGRVHEARHATSSTTTLAPPTHAPQASEPTETSSEAAPEPSPEATREPAEPPAPKAPASTETPTTPAREAPASQSAPEPREAEASAPVVSGGS